MPIDWSKWEQEARAQLGKPYKMGSKWDPKEDDPKGPIDCSGLGYWLYNRRGILIPQGSYVQIGECIPLASGWKPLRGDAGFVESAEGSIDHVIYCLGDGWVIEARGQDPRPEFSNKVIFREAAAWERYMRFKGWYRFKAVIDLENKKG